MRVAYLGPPGTFTHRAALREQADELVPCRTIREVFESVATGRTDAGVVPAENAIEGWVRETLDGLLAGRAFVAGETVLPIEHTLLGRSGARIVRVYSHPQALAQCADWLDANLPDAERVACLSTGEAAALTAGDPESAAIAPARVGLDVLAERIGPEGNRTRFYVLRPQVEGPTGNDRSLVAFSAPHRPGALHACLAPFAESGVNLNRIESRPARDTPWTYNFVAEVEGHPERAPVQDALVRLGEVATWVRVLGAWPVRTAPDA